MKLTSIDFEHNELMDKKFSYRAKNKKKVHSLISERFSSISLLNLE